MDGSDEVGPTVQEEDSQEVSRLVNGATLKDMRFAPSS